MVPLSVPPSATTKVSLLFAAPVRFSNPLNETPATWPAFGPAIVHVVSVLGPTSVSAAPLPVTLDRFAKVTPAVSAGFTVPAPAPVSVQLDEAEATVSELDPPPPSNVIGAPIAPPAVSTVRSSAPAPPVTLMLETCAAGRVELVPFAVTEMSVPDAEIVTLPSEVMFQGARNVSETDASVADGTEAVTETTPWSDFVTCTEQVPVVPVVHVLAP